MLYALMKTLHLLGVVLLIGNVTVTSFWKVFADRSRNAGIIVQAQRMVTLTDWVFTTGGILLIIIGGFGAAYVGGIPPFGARWLIEAELLFALSGTIWLAVLVPLQAAQTRQARIIASEGIITTAYVRSGRLWLFWGIMATIPLIRAAYLMVLKP